MSQDGQRTKRILLTPGPVHVDSTRYLKIEEMHHREDSFRRLMEETSFLLSKAFGTSGSVVTISSSGTGGMEAAVANFVSENDRALIISAGKFGDRWAEILKSYGHIAKLVRLSPERPIDIDQLAKLIGKEHPDSLFMTHVESSTGMLFPLKRLMDKIRGTETLIIVDSIASLGAEELRMDEWGIDVMIGASQKAFSVPPGLAFVAFGDRAKERMKRVASKGYYLNLEMYLEDAPLGNPPFTPSIPLIQMMMESLGRFDDFGWENVIKRHAAFSEVFYKCMQSLGFKALSKNPSNAVQVLRVPKGLPGKATMPGLIESRTGFVVADGQGEYKGKVIRTGYLGIHRGRTVADFLLRMFSLSSELGIVADENLIEEAAAGIVEIESIFVD